MFWVMGGMVGGGGLGLRFITCWRRILLVRCAPGPKSDEVFHFYMGDAVEMLRLYPGGRGERVVIGTDLAEGERPQVVVEKNIWQGSRLVRGGSWALLGCSVSPGFEFEDYEAGVREELLAGWPGWGELVRGLTR